MNDKSKRSYSPLPKKAAQFHFIHELIRTVFPESMRNATTKTFCYISYDVPFPISSFFRGTQISRAFWSAFILTFVFCFVGQCVTTYLQGTLLGAEEGKKYFLNDYHNLANYMLVCPIYVGLSTIFMLTLMNIRSGINALLLNLNESEKKISSGKMPAWALVFISLLIPSIGIPNYISESLNPAVFKTEYWFLSTISSGERILNVAGVYYVLVNFTLQVISVMGIISFAYMASFTGQLSKLIEHRNLKKELDFDSLKKNLNQFVYAYVIAKSLVAVYMVNIVYTWPVANPSESQNFLVAVALILVIGLVIVPFPRYIIQKHWYDFTMRRAEAEYGEYPTYQDLRSEKIQGYSLYLDIFIIGHLAREIWLVTTVPQM